MIFGPAVGCYQIAWIRGLIGSEQPMKRPNGIATHLGVRILSRLRLLVVQLPLHGLLAYSTATLFK